MSIQPPQNFLNQNAQASKQLAIVVDIDGIDYLTSTTIASVLRYGDPVNYGDPGIEYGGVGPSTGTINGRGQRNLISLNGGSLTIQQTIEPEQGRASISTLQMAFVDKDQYITQVCSPGVIVDEILGSEVKIWLGYAGASFPEDYYQVWRGRVAQTIPSGGLVTMQFVDPSIVRRQQIFNMGQTNILNGGVAIDNVQTTIPLVGNGDFAQKVLGPDGVTYDTDTIRCFLQIDSEFIEYQQAGQEATGFGSNEMLNVVRGALGTVAASHDDGTQVDGFLLMTGHAVDLALKIMLSGWQGPYITGQSIFGLVTTGDASNPTVTNGITLSENIDAVRDLGLTAGDYITITGATNGGNDVTCIVTGFLDSEDTLNKIILTNTNFTAESPSPAVLALRSQFDTLPDLCGCRMPAQEVDVETHLYYKNTFLVDTANSYQFLLSSDDADAGKTFIENQIMLPLGAYALTRQGRISMGLTNPPIADQRTVTLNASNVINPSSIKVTRAINNRKYFNEIDWTYDYDIEGNPASTRDTLDTDSLNTFGLSSVLPIDSKGARSAMSLTIDGGDIFDDLNFETIVASREQKLFLRYANVCILVDLTVNFEAGNQIEAGDVVLISDNGGLQIANLQTGVRDFGVQLFEVINRSLDLKSGQCQLQLQGGLGSLVSDRYATVSPSSLLTGASTASKIVIEDSFGAIFPGAEFKKWTSYIGLEVNVHSPDYTTRNGTTVFFGFDPTNNYAMILSPPLGFTPQANDILDIAQYPNNSNAQDQALYKLIHCFLDPSVAVVSGASGTQFDVGSGDIGLFAVGQTILVHNPAYTDLSGEVQITNITSDTITVGTAFGFTPDNTCLVELIGFPDGGGPYRLV